MAIDKSSSETVGVGADTWVVDTLDDAHSTAESIAGQLRSIVSEVSVAAEVGKPHDVLVAEATRLEARLIVVGNRRMQGIGRVLGSVANSVAHNAPCDVYIVKTV
jgi:nucleotide-binding universal stress UspA family protein